MSNAVKLRIMGYTSIVSAFLFGLNVAILGLVQPGYNHFIDTISVLALGKWGFLQQINFLVLAAGLISIGIGFSLLIHKKHISPISLLFLFFAASVLLLILFSADPVDRTTVKLVHMNTWEGFFHITLTMAIIALTAPAVLLLSRGMKQSETLKQYIPYTTKVFVLNMVFGGLWFIFRRLGILFEWKGLWQKLLALNVLIWMARMGLVFINHSNKK